MKTPPVSKRAFNKAEKLKKQFHEKCQQIAQNKLEKYDIKEIESPDAPKNKKKGKKAKEVRKLASKGKK